MPLFYVILGFFILKGLLAWPFYASQKTKPLLIGLLLAMAEAPFLTLLYHDTDINFWIPFFFLMVFDGVVYFLLLKQVIWKAILVATLVNFFGFIFFIIVNG